MTYFSTNSLPSCTITLSRKAPSCKSGPGKVLAAALAIGGFVATQAPAWAAPVTLDSSIRIQFLGIGVGKLNSTVTIDKNAYSINGYAKTSGVGRVVGRTKADFKSHGSFSGSQIYSSALRAGYESRKKRGSLKMSFAGGNLVHKVSVPPVKYKEGAVPVLPDHLRNVVDPLSAMLFPVGGSGVGNGRSVCDRTVPVYDGKIRMNLVFSYKGKARAKSDGFNGEVFKCSVRYRPVAGMRSFKKNVKFMKANRDLEVTMARVGNTNVYALYAFRVRTQKGVASGTNKRFIAR